MPGPNIALSIGLIEHHGSFGRRRAAVEHIISGDEEKAESDKLMKELFSVKRHILTIAVHLCSPFVCVPPHIPCATIFVLSSAHDHVLEDALVKDPTKKKAFDDFAHMMRCGNLQAQAFPSLSTYPYSQSIQMRP